MTNVQSKTMLLLLFALLLSKVRPWTVDLAEVQKLLDEEQANDNDTDSIQITDSENEILYSSNYAENFKYGTFEKKEVGSFIKNGTIYLEGLSKALADYRETLDFCNQNSSKLESEEQKFSEKNTTCDKAMKNSDYVRRLSQLALRTANKLRDKAYDNKFQDDDTEENELLLQLAWSIDRLAYLTGYEPKAKDFTENSTEISTLSIETTEQPTTEDNQALEILEQAENGRPVSNLPPKSATELKSVQKRDVDDPLSDVMKYYSKYKVWNGSNIISGNNEGNTKFDVNNNLKVLPIHKRSLTPKKAINMRIRHAMNKLNKRIKNSKNGVRKLIRSIKIYRRKILKNDTY